MHTNMTEKITKCALKPMKYDINKYVKCFKLFLIYYTNVKKEYKMFYTIETIVYLRCSALIERFYRRSSH
jgi:hypothetical protein